MINCNHWPVAFISRSMRRSWSFSSDRRSLRIYKHSHCSQLCHLFLFVWLLHSERGESSSEEILPHQYLSLSTFYKSTNVALIYTLTQLNSKRSMCDHVIWCIIYVLWLIMSYDASPMIYDWSCHMMHHLWSMIDHVIWCITYDLWLIISYDASPMIYDWSCHMMHHLWSVSYTHLTLPTIYSV